MPHSPHISLANAILINLNVMVGAGIFINTVILARVAGPYGAGTYVLVGLAILPLMMCFARLAQQYPAGSLYTYGAALHAQVGLLSTWSYFHAKLASCAVAIHVAATILQAVMANAGLAAIAQLPLYCFDIGFVVIFTLLNCYNLRTGKALQAIFMAGKLIPIATILVLTAVVVHAPVQAMSSAAHWSDMIVGVPLVIYAFMGFEASSGFTRSLIDAPRNAWRAMAVAFALGVIITTAFQYCIYQAIPDVGMLSSYLIVFPTILHRLGITGMLAQACAMLLHGGIAISAAGVGFSIMYANSGNLHELATRHHIRGATALIPLNHYHVAAGCILVEALIVMLYLLLGALCIGGSFLPFLQQIAACGVTVTYAISVASLWCTQRLQNRSCFVPAWGLISCALLFAALIRSGMILGWSPYLAYIVMQLLGVAVLVL